MRTAIHRANACQSAEFP